MVFWTPLLPLEVFTARRRQNAGLSASTAGIFPVCRSPEENILGICSSTAPQPPFMEHTRSGSDILVRIDPGEEIHTALKKLADDLGFDAAAITSGIGRTRENHYGYMNEEGIYKRRLLGSPSELVSLSGNIARTENGDAFISTVVGQMMKIMYTLDICLSPWFMLLLKYMSE